MTILWKQIFQLFKLLNSETGIHQISWGVALGFILGMAPTLSLQSILVFICLIFFRIQFGAALATAFFFKFVAFLLDPVFHKVGTVVLTHEPLLPLFEKMYNMPLVPLTRFYNSIVMGSGVLSILLAPVIYLATLYVVKKYRVHIFEKIKNSRLLKMAKATGLYQWYKKYDEFT